MIVSSEQIYSYTEECNLMIQNKDSVDTVETQNKSILTGTIMVFIVRSRFNDVTKGHISKLSRLLSRTLRKKNLVYTL